jgi:hypothetical protein
VRELVPIANRLGFFWGGHFQNRLDGNHFEVAHVLTDAEVSPRFIGQARLRCRCSARSRV